MKYSEASQSERHFETQSCVKRLGVPAPVSPLIAAAQLSTGKAGPNAKIEIADQGVEMLFPMYTVPLQAGCRFFLKP